MVPLGQPLLRCNHQRHQWHFQRIFLHNNCSIKISYILYDMHLWSYPPLLFSMFCHVWKNSLIIADTHFPEMYLCFYLLSYLATCMFTKNFSNVQNRQWIFFRKIGSIYFWAADGGKKGCILQRTVGAMRKLQAAISILGALCHTRPRSWRGWSYTTWDMVSESTAIFCLWLVVKPSLKVQYT